MTSQHGCISYCTMSAFVLLCVHLYEPFLSRVGFLLIFLTQKSWWHEHFLPLFFFFLQLTGLYQIWSAAKGVTEIYIHCCFCSTHSSSSMQEKPAITPVLYAGKVKGFIILSEQHNQNEILPFYFHIKDIQTYFLFSHRYFNSICSFFWSRSLFSYLLCLQL